MAALSRADVEEMIATALSEFEQRIGSHIQAMQAEHVSVVDAWASFATLADGTHQEFLNSSNRIEQLITSNNATFDEHGAALQKVVEDLQQAGVDGPRIAMALEGTKQLNENNLALRKCIEAFACGSRPRSRR